MRWRILYTAFQLHARNLQNVYTEKLDFVDVNQSVSMVIIWMCTKFLHVSSVVTGKIWMKLCKIYLFSLKMTKAYSSNLRWQVIRCFQTGKNPNQTSERLLKSQTFAQKNSSTTHTNYFVQRLQRPPLQYINVSYAYKYFKQTCTC